MNNKAKIAVLGDKDSIMVFKALGFHTVYVEASKEIDKAIHKLAREGYAVIYITETCAERAEETLEFYKTESFPAIIPIPSRFGTNGLGAKGIKHNIEKAIGADIF